MDDRYGYSLKATGKAGREERARKVFMLVSMFYTASAIRARPAYTRWFLSVHLSLTFSQCEILTGFCLSICLSLMPMCEVVDMLASLCMSIYLSDRCPSVFPCMSFSQWIDPRWAMPLKEMAPSVSVDLSLVTSCVGLREEKPQQPAPCPLHGRVIQPLAC